jgi:hypothetical protein
MRRGWGLVGKLALPVGAVEVVLAYTLLGVCRFPLVARHVHIFPLARGFAVCPILFLPESSPLVLVFLVGILYTVRQRLALSIRPILECVVILVGHILHELTLLFQEFG